MLLRPLQRRLRLLTEKSVGAGRAANGGAQLSHLVDYFSKPTSPTASTSGVHRSNQIEGEDLPEGPGHGLAVQPGFVVHDSITSRRSEAPGLLHA